jgi:hypothetical protein
MEEHSLVYLRFFHAIFFLDFSMHESSNVPHDLEKNRKMHQTNRINVPHEEKDAAITSHGPTKKKMRQSHLMTRTTRKPSSDNPIFYQRGD